MSTSTPGSTTATRKTTRSTVALKRAVRKPTIVHWRIEVTNQDQLEEIFALPEVDEPEINVIQKEEAEEEWLPVCRTRLASARPSWETSDSEKKECGKAAVANLTLICPFCGPSRFGYCEEHLAQGIAGRLCCSGCSRKAKTNIYKKPLKAIWKSDD